MQSRRENKKNTYETTSRRKEDININESVIESSKSQRLWESAESFRHFFELSSGRAIMYANFAVRNHEVADIFRSHI